LLIVATGLGSGYAPVASGTFGTLVAIPFYLLLSRLTPWMQVLSTAAFCGIAIEAADRAGRHFGESDDGRIVVDEVAGYLITMLLVTPSLASVCFGFLFFRIADIFKPWPASYFDQKVHSGLGTVMDDLVAGGYARLALAAVLAFGPW
jgi:phosphatidylglycerophosphatase A